MGEFQAMVVIFITIATVCVTICIAFTILTFIYYIRQAREYSAEIEHLKLEVKACRELLKRKK